MILKLGGVVVHVTTIEGQRSRSQGYVTYQQQECYNLAAEGRINFKFGGSYQHKELNM